MKKFESKLGIGEIAHYVHDERRNQDEFVKVIGITIAIDQLEPVYFCRYPNGVTTHFAESELLPDPDFNDETGYPDDK